MRSFQPHYGSGRLASRPSVRRAEYNLVKCLVPRLQPGYALLLRLLPHHRQCCYCFLFADQLGTTLGTTALLCYLNISPHREITQKSVANWRDGSSRSGPLISSRAFVAPHAGSIEATSCLIESATDHPHHVENPIITKQSGTFGRTCRGERSAWTTIGNCCKTIRTSTF